MAAHPYRPNCPCAGCADAESWTERSSDALDKLTAQLRKDEACCREAEQWVAGTFDPDHYTDLTLALHQLHHTDPSDLPGSDLLARLYRLARVEGEAMDRQLREQAESYPARRIAA